MDTIPTEILDKILLQTLEPDVSDTERIPHVDQELLEKIMDQRLVCRGFNKSMTDTDVVVRLIEATVFDWSSASIDKLGAIANVFPGLTHKVTTLSFSAYPFKVGNTAPEVYMRENYPHDLRTHLAKFPNIQHFKYYLLPPTMVHTKFCMTPEDPPGNELRDVHPTRGFNSDADPGDPFLPWTTDISDIYFFAVLSTLDRAGLTLKSVKISSLGNHGKWGVLTCTMFNLDLNHISYLNPKVTQIEELAVNLVASRAMNQMNPYGPPLFGSGFWSRETLRKLEVTLVWDFDFETQVCLTKPLNMGRAVFPLLEEVRIQANTACYFSEDELMAWITRQPALRRLGLAYIQLREGTWDSLLDRIKELYLEELLLINPMAIHTRREVIRSAADCLVETYLVKNDIVNVAKTVKVLYTDDPWSIRPNHSAPVIGVCFDYVGFSIFENGHFKKSKTYASYMNLENVLMLRTRVLRRLAINGGLNVELGPKDMR